MVCGDVHGDCVVQVVCHYSVTVGGGVTGEKERVSIQWKQPYHERGLTWLAS